MLDLHPPCNDYSSISGFALQCSAWILQANIILKGKFCLKKSVMHVPTNLCNMLVIKISFTLFSLLSAAASTNSEASNVPVQNGKVQNSPKIKLNHVCTHACACVNVKTTAHRHSVTLCRALAVHLQASYIHQRY